MILNQTYGFVGENALVAPQANAMAAVIKPLMEGGATPWMLYFAGAALALIQMCIRDSVYPKPRYIFSFCSDSGFCVVRPVRLDRSVKAFLH